MRTTNFRKWASGKLSAAKARGKNAARKIIALPASRRLHKEFQAESSRRLDKINSAKATILFLEERLRGVNHLRSIPLIGQLASGRGGLANQYERNIRWTMGFVGKNKGVWGKKTPAAAGGF